MIAFSADFLSQFGSLYCKYHIFQKKSSSTMAKPPYATIMLLNPVENAIQEYQQIPNKESFEENHLITAPSRGPSYQRGNLLPKQKIAICLWLMITLAVFNSWFSLTISIPKLQCYYEKSFLEISLMFWILPVTAALLIPGFSKLLHKYDESLIFLMVAAFANAIGSAIKCRGTERNGYLITFTGQVLTLLALLFSFGFPLLFLKQYPSRKWLVTSLGITAGTLGSIFGISSLPLLLSDDKSFDKIGVHLYKYFLYNAVFAVAPLLLIPFAVKEEKQYSSTNYDAFIVANASSTCDAEPRCERNNTGVLWIDPISFRHAFLSVIKEKKFLLNVTATGISLSLFLGMFFAVVRCIQTEAKQTWTVCIIESMVIITCPIYIYVAYNMKLGAPRWMIHASHFIMITLAVTYAVCLETKSLALHFSLFFLLHTSYGFYYFVCFKETTQSTRFNRVNLAFVVIFIHGFIASTICFLLSCILWKFNVVAWAVTICIFSFLLILFSIFSVK